ncbi:hypothetical protein, partial [Niabella aquatica]
LFLSSGYTSVPDSYKYGSDDAATGQMLAPDNYVQYALSPSGYNRYLYANGNPLKYTDPSGDLSHAEWNQAMSLIENTVGTGGGNGGYISSGMGSPYIFKSMDEAFGYGVGYISDHGWWGGTAPGSAGQALANYSARTRGSGRVTAGMWNGYMSAQWSGYAYDINTMNASSVKLGNGFQTTGLTYAHANLGGFVTTFYSYSKAEALFLQQSNGGSENGGLNLGDWGNILTGGGYLANGLGTQIDAIVKRNYHGYNPKSVIRTGKYLPYNIRVSTKALQNTASTLKTAGNAAGFMSLGITTYQYFDGQISGTEALVDGFFGVLGFFPATAGISILYFGGKALYEYSTGNTFFEKPGGQ